MKIEKYVLSLIVPCALGCAGEAVQPSSAAPAPPTSSGAEAALQPGVSAAPPTSAKPTLCGVGTSEGEVMDEVLARSGRGLLWLVTDRADPDRREQIKRGAEEVHSARALAECLLSVRDPGFDPTQSKGFPVLQAWVDAHVGPEHAQTLLAAGVAYFASLLVSKSWIDAALDVPATRLFLERANAANPQLADGLGPLILGGYECFVPKAFGGQPESGLRRLQDAASREGSLRLAMKVAAAELCAFSLQDRALFERLLAEVSAAKPTNATFDLLAKQRAETLRTEAEDMFPEL